MLKSIGGKSFIEVKNKSFKEKEKEAFDKLADKMDKRDKVFEIMKEIEEKNLPLPEKYTRDAAIMLNYESYKAFGSWRNNQPTVITLRKAARKIAKKH